MHTEAVELCRVNNKDDVTNGYTKERKKQREHLVIEAYSNTLDGNRFVANPYDWYTSFYVGYLTKNLWSCKYVQESGYDPTVLSISHDEMFRVTGPILDLWHA